MHSFGKRRSRRSRSRRSRRSRGSLKSNQAKFYKLAAIDSLKYKCRSNPNSKKCKSIKRQLASLKDPGLWSSIKYEWNNWNKIKR
jgi:hypothetical protein